MYNNSFIILLSILTGISFSLIISSIYMKPYIYKGPNSKDIKKNIYYKDKKCYKLIPKHIKCPYKTTHD